MEYTVLIWISLATWQKWQMKAYLESPTKNAKILVVTGILGGGPRSNLEYVYIPEILHFEAQNMEVWFRCSSSVGSFLGSMF